MSKSKPKAEAAPAVFKLTIEEFCTRLSASDRRVELIGAFHATETKAGRRKDSEDNFRARFAAFLKTPA